MTGAKAVECPECGRMITIDNRNQRFARHSDESNHLTLCPMSGKDVTQEALAATANVQRAQQVVTMAGLLRDEDPRMVWNALTYADPVEVRRLLMTALAAIDPERPLSELFGWARELAVAS
jgi:hypothetical protein